MATPMDSKQKSRLKTFLGVGVFVLLAYLFLNTPPVQDYMGRLWDFLDPKRYEHLEEQLKDRPDAELLRLLHHGDNMKAETAKYLLARRGKPELFGPVVKKLKSWRKEIRERARVLLAALDRDRAIQVYMQELQTLPKDLDEYRQTLSILANLKHQPMYPYLVEYAKSGPDGYGFGSAGMFKALGDPKAIPLLEEYLAKAKGNDVGTSLHRDALVDAIQSLKMLEQKESD